MQSFSEETIEEDSEWPEAEVTRNDNAIFYDGYLGREANDRVASLLGPDVEKLVIRSRGGLVDHGMELGELVFDNALDVEVEDYCFSSCANYVLPAGKRKFLNENSQLGWHGGAMQDANSDFVSSYNKMDPSMRSKFLRTIADEIERETDFFAKIGVKRSITVYGLDDGFDTPDNGDCIGWRYSLESMKKFGLGNIVLNDGVWSPADRFEDKCILTIGDVE